MPIIPRRSFWEMEKWFDEEWPEIWRRPRIMLRMGDLAVPKMDIYETEKEVVTEVELPGVNPEDIEVEVRENVLVVQAKRKAEKEEKNKGYYRKEISSGFYRRAVPLPAEVIAEKADASYKEGMLKISIPKKEVKKVKPKKAKKIKVKKA